VWYIPPDVGVLGYVITLSLKLIPSPEFGDKLISVTVDHYTGYMYPGCDIPFDGHNGKDITLKKQKNYKCKILSESTEMKLKFDDYVDTEGITVESRIVVQHCYFDTIKEIQVPSPTTLVSLGNLLVFSEEESREKFCDVTLTAPLVSQSPGKFETCVKFFAHKAILAVRSPVFARMFMHNMQESVTNTVNLPDIEPDVLKELLIYIYTTESPNIKKHAPSLLCLAEKYQLEHLKVLCERRLSYDLEVDSVARVLILADACDAEKLKQNALLYISEHGDEVKKTEDWNDVKKNPDLMDNLLDVMFDPYVKFKRQRLL
jgi:thiol-disulfide isomerase/thioredoxin